VSADEPDVQVGGAAAGAVSSPRRAVVVANEAVVVGVKLEAGAGAGGGSYPSAGDGQTVAASPRAGMYKLAEQEEERKLKSTTQVGPLIRMAMECVHEAKHGGYQTRQLKAALQQRMEADMSYAYELSKLGRTYSTLQTRWVTAASKTEKALTIVAQGGNAADEGDAMGDVSEEEMLQALLVAVGGSFESAAGTINTVNQSQVPAPQQEDIVESVFESEEPEEQQQPVEESGSILSTLSDLHELATAVDAQMDEPAKSLEYFMEVRRRAVCTCTVQFSFSVEGVLCVPVLRMRYFY
jgi:hypothetical protein